MEDMKNKTKKISKETYDWLVKIPPTQQTRYTFAKEVKNDHITNIMMVF